MKLLVFDKASLLNNGPLAKSGSRAKSGSWRRFFKVINVICGLFICDFAYMRSRNGLFSGTYLLINSHPWSFYMRVYFWSPYLSHITRATCNQLLVFQKCGPKSCEPKNLPIPDFKPTQSRTLKPTNSGP